MHLSQPSDIKTKLKPGHPLHTLISEHEVILRFLDKLEKVTQIIKRIKDFENQKEFNELKHIAEHLIEAEPHHKREEEVLFPELERRGVLGPPEVMRLEHAELRKKKEELKEISQSFNKENFVVLKERLEEISNFIITFLRNHIFKENNILFPIALEVITEPDVWQKMKIECDKIGYCCFTPKDAQ